MPRPGARVSHPRCDWALPCRSGRLGCQRGENLLEAWIWILFASLVAAPILAGAVLGLLGRRMDVRREAVAEWRRRGMPQREPATLRDLARMAEYDRRYRRTFVVTLAGWAGGGVLVAVSLPMSGIALAILSQIYARRAYLRCPECDVSPGLRALRWGRGCPGCGAKLRP